jgi:nucleoside-diphosphate-sugar epimerase
LWKELLDRGHDVTLFNRGKTEKTALPRETDAQFQKRVTSTKYIIGDRTNPDSIKEKLGGEKFDVVYDMNGREASDTQPVADIFNGKVDHYVYMSSAGVYKKALVMPHREGDAEDPKSRHKGKLETEAYLKSIGIPFTSIRPTYIYGPGNYNPLEEYFFTRLDAKRRICIPGHGQHLTGLGHVEDLAVAMANVIGKDVAKGKIYNVQDRQSVSFEGLAKLCGKAMGLKDSEVDIKLYDAKAFDFGKKKAFPMREQHFFCAVDQAMIDLDWTPKYNMLAGLKDAYENDFKAKKARGGLDLDFSTDDQVLTDDRIAVKMYTGIPADVV